MGAVYLVSDAAGSQVDNTTHYHQIVGALDLGAITTEGGELSVRSAGAFSNLTLNVLFNTCSVTSTFTLRKSRAATALQLTITTDATGVFTNTGSVAYAATDEAGYELAIPTEAGTNSMTFQCAGIVWTATTGTTSWIGGGTTGHGASSDAKSLNFADGTQQSTEANSQSSIGAAFTVTDLFVNVSSNSRTTDTFFTLRTNGVGVGGSTLTYASAETGQKEVALSAAIAVGDLVNARSQTGSGSGTITYSGYGCEYSSSNGDWPLIAALSSGVAQAFNVTNNVALAGRATVTTTETDVQVTPRLTFAVAKLYAYVSANTIATSASTVTLRVDAANSALTVSYAAAETGIKSDTSNSVTVTNNTNAINWQIVTPNTSGTFTLRSISAIGHIDVAGVTADQLIGVFDQQLSGAFVGLVYQ